MGGRCIVRWEGSLTPTLPRLSSWTAMNSSGRRHAANNAAGCSAFRSGALPPFSGPNSHTNLLKKKAWASCSRGSSSSRWATAEARNGVGSAGDSADPEEGVPLHGTRWTTPSVRLNMLTSCPQPPPTYSDLWFGAADFSKPL